MSHPTVSCENPNMGKKSSFKLPFSVPKRKESAFGGGERAVASFLCKEVKEQQVYCAI